MSKIEGEWTETIICPVCDFEQISTVKKQPRLPFVTYIHECDACGYIITESEWQQVESEAKQ